MSKNKNKGSKKDKASSDPLNKATVELKRFRRFSKQVKKLSTTQKVVAGLALLAAGYAFYTTTSPANDSAEEPDPHEPVPQNPEASTPEPPSKPGARARPSKTKSGKQAGTNKHSPFSEEHS